MEENKGTIIVKDAQYYNGDILLLADIRLLLFFCQYLYCMFNCAFSLFLVNF